MTNPAPKFPRNMSVEERSAVLRDYSHRVVDSLVMMTAKANGIDPMIARARLKEAHQTDDVRTLAEFHCGISWLVERVELLEAQVRTLTASGRKGRK